MSFDGNEPFFPKVLGMLRAKLPEFHWRVDIVLTKEYMLPSRRERVLLRGIHRCFGGTEVPPLLKPFGMAHLTDFLAKGLPNTPTAALTKQQQKNKEWYESQVAHALDAKRIGPHSIVVCVLDRSHENVYSTQWKIDECPTLTTHNRYLWLMIAAEVIAEGMN